MRNDAKFLLERYKLLEQCPITYHELIDWAPNKCPFSNELLTESSKTPYMLKAVHPTSGAVTSKRVNVSKWCLEYYEKLSLEFRHFSTIDDYFDIFVKLGTRIVSYNGNEVRMCGFIYMIQDHTGLSKESTMIELSNWYGVYPSEADAILNAMFQIKYWEE